MRKIFFTALLVSLTMSIEAQPRTDADLGYDVWPSAKGKIKVRACFPPGKTMSLKAQSHIAHQIIKPDPNLTLGRISNSGKRLNVKASNQTRCVGYEADIAQASQLGEWRDAYQAHHSWASWSGVWLWRNAQLDQGYAVRFHHDKQTSISAPWPLLERRDTLTTYRLDKTSPEWPNLVAYGDFEAHHIEMGHSTVRLALLPTKDGIDRSMLISWAKANVEALNGIYGRLPLKSPQLLVVPIGRGNSPVPWGHVQRGGGTSVHVFINETKSRQTFFDDWTLAHELSHTLHPYMGTSGRWLAEGIASYYQNISRGRTGLLSEKQAWEKLDAGLQRGLKGAQKTSHKTLLEPHKNTMRIYWSGAAIALIADTHLRIQSHGQQSLDSVLKEFARCHFPSQKRWASEDFLQELDKIANTSIFNDLYQKYVLGTEFPDLTETYQQLGLKRLGSELVFAPGINGNSLRQQFMNQQQYIASRSCPSRG